jgi:hypothetical protein
MLSSGSRISFVVHQLSCFGVGFSLCFITRGLFLCFSPFLWGKVSDLSADPCCQHIVMVCWLFFNFAVLFDFVCCSLAQEMSFVDRYLPYFKQHLITLPLSAIMPFQPLFTEHLCRDQLLAPPTFCGVILAAPPLCCVLVFSSLFIVQFYFVFYFCRRGCQSA